jgi:hypothetical protein
LTGALYLAKLAALGVILELLIIEKELLACGEHKVISTVRALQKSIRKLHCAFSHRAG